MNLSETSANIRPRNPYEAIDLGATMVRHWWKELWLIWFSVSLPFLLIIWVALYQHKGWTLLLLWWCKPLWETPLLHFIAEKLFNNKTTAKEILRRTPKLLLNDIIPKLTLRRISITRSFDMPVSELERLKSTARNKRLNVLHRTSSSAAIWLTIVGTHMETFLLTAFISLIWLFIPEHVAWDLSIFDFFVEEEYAIWRYLFAYLAMSAIGPFYVAAGFSLYINRRTILEAWDIELTFKQLANRTANVTGTLACIVVVASVMTIAQPNQAFANSDDYHYTPNQSRDDIINIAESDSFNRIKEVELWLPKDRDLEDQEEPLDLSFLDSFFKIFSSLAKVLELLLWGIAIALVIFILIKLSQYRLKKARGKGLGPITTAPDTLFGLDIRKGSLPNDVIGAAKTLWQQQQFRDAYSLLYRGALAHIAHVRAVPLHESFTEEECVEQFQTFDDGLEPLFFAQLTQQWQMIAYGHQVPENSIFETTCDGWHFHFAEARQGDHHG
ncbi:MAG: hypothetical protein MI976_12285 [Pseudomonadales bacterium]|nr:hypothetical protein [Pseudomonadales bacterium]